MLGLQPTCGLTAQVGWLGLKVGGHLTLPEPMNRVNSRSNFVTITALQTSYGYYYYYYYYY